MNRINELLKKCYDLIFNPKFWFVFGLFSIFNGFMDLIVWEIFSFYVPCWVISILSFGVAVIYFFIWYLLKFEMRD